MVMKERKSLARTAAVISRIEIPNDSLILLNVKSREIALQGLSKKKIKNNNNEFFIYIRFLYLNHDKDTNITFSNTKSIMRK